MASPSTEPPIETPQAVGAFYESATSRARQLFNAKRLAAEPVATTSSPVDMTSEKGPVKLSTAPSEVVKSSATVQWRENRRQMLNSPKVLLTFRF